MALCDSCGIFKYLFIYIFQTCVAIAPGGCTLGTATTTSLYPNTETSTDSNLSSSTTEGVTPPQICPEGFWGNIPHEYRCDAFYMCAGGNAILLTCSAGFEFDPVLAVSFILYSFHFITASRAN